MPAGDRAQEKQDRHALEHVGVYLSHAVAEAQPFAERIGHRRADDEDEQRADQVLDVERVAPAGILKLVVERLGPGLIHRGQQRAEEPRVADLSAAEQQEHHEAPHRVQRCEPLLAGIHVGHRQISRLHS